MAEQPPIDDKTQFVVDPKADPKVVAAEEQAEKTSTSKGERLFNWLTYGGIAGIGTFIATIPIAYWAKYGGGAKVFSNGAKSLQSLGLGAETAEHAMMTTATMQGGNLTIIPVKLMENHKPELIEKFNNMLGDKSSDASVENDTKQTWGSLIKARLLFAWLPVFGASKVTASIIGEDKFAKFQDKFAEWLVCKPLGKPTHMPGMAKVVENETKLFRYGKIAALDVFATAAAASLLFVGSRIFARKNESWHAKDVHVKPVENSPEEQKDTPATLLPDTTPSKLFSETVPRKAPDLKPRNEGFAETVATQKVAAAEATPGMSA